MRVLVLALLVPAVPLGKRQRVELLERAVELTHRTQQPCALSTLSHIHQPSPQP